MPNPNILDTRLVSALTTAALVYACEHIEDFIDSFNPTGGLSMDEADYVRDALPAITSVRALVCERLDR